MMVCNDCKAQFLVPARRTESIGSPWGIPTSRCFHVCPMCGSEEIEEATQCRACNEPCPVGDNLCEDCRTSFDVMLESFIKTASENYHLTYDEVQSEIADALERM